MKSPRVGLIYDTIMGGHKASGFHCERPERIYSIYQALQAHDLLDKLIALPSKEASRTELELAHCSDYLDRTFSDLSQPGQINLPDYDMFANGQTLKAALTAAGSTLHLTKEVMEDNLDSGFAIVRPPGHHATSGQCMGFCFFNNLGISAIHVAQTGKRVMIVDIDVHHGNGTQKIVKKHKELRNLLFYSIHRWDNGTFYPGTGKPCDTERVVNVGFNGSKGDTWYLDTFDNRLIPRAQQFAPELIMVSCGFDAAAGDPLGQCGVTPEGYYAMIKRLQSVCPKIVLVLEGGYNLSAISNSAVACVQALLNSRASATTGLRPDNRVVASSSMLLPSGAIPPLRGQDSSCERSSGPHPRGV